MCLEQREPCRQVRLGRCDASCGQLSSQNKLSTEYGFLMFLIFGREAFHIQVHDQTQSAKVSRDSKVHSDTFRLPIPTFCNQSLVREFFKAGVRQLRKLLDKVSRKAWGSVQDPRNFDLWHPWHQPGLEMIGTCWNMDSGLASSHCGAKQVNAGCPQHGAEKGGG